MSRKTLTTENGTYDSSGVAVVCEHIGNFSKPILLGLRTAPLEPEDSGWQFLCDSVSEEEVSHAKVWSLTSVLKYEPTLAGLLDSPSGTKIVRKDLYSQWSVIRQEEKH